MSSVLCVEGEVSEPPRDVGILLGIPIDRKDLHQITADTLCAVDRRLSQRIFVCANPHSLVVAQGDIEFQSALKHANVVVVDGIGAAVMARAVGIHIGRRLTGTDYFQAVMRALQRRGRGRIFFFGSSRKVLNLIAERAASEFPSLTVCGTLSPPFGPWSDEENRRMVATINAAKPDILWVGMTAPKQEKWVEANRWRLHVPVIGSIGAVFDFYAGTYGRAPRWICRIGLEWAYRFMLEPRRMWKRNLVSAPTFVWLVLKRHLTGRE